jgi:hypothetical protein
MNYAGDKGLMRYTLLGCSGLNLDLVPIIYSDIDALVFLEGVSSKSS